MFKVGDKVRVIDGDGGGHKGDIVTVVSVDKRLGNGQYYYELQGLSNGAVGLYEERLELINEGPVRSVTRREIVEGQYGGIHVMRHEPGHVLLGFEIGGDLHFKSFSAEQLAELEHLSAQLREALEDA